MLLVVLLLVLITLLLAGLANRRRRLAKRDATATAVPKIIVADCPNLSKRNPDTTGPIIRPIDPMAPIHPIHVPWIQILVRAFALERIIISYLRFGADRFGKHRDNNRLQI